MILNPCKGDSGVEYSPEVSEKMNLTEIFSADYGVFRQPWKDVNNFWKLNS